MDDETKIMNHARFSLAPPRGNRCARKEFAKQIAVRYSWVQPARRGDKSCFFPAWAALVCLGIVFPPTQPSCSAQDHGPTCGAQGVFKMADAELKQKRYDQAEQELDRLRSCGSLSSIDTFNLGWLYGRAHNFKKALTEFNKS